jgi:hydroxyacylglutathione hydrolase
MAPRLGRSTAARDRKPTALTRPRDPRRWLLAARPEPVADGVVVVRGGISRAMNVYLIDEPDSRGVVAYDAGEKGMAPAILAAARARGGLALVVLGHGDTDHRGAAPALRAAGGGVPGGAAGSIPIACHPDARPHAEGSGGRDYWRPELLPGAVRVLHRVMHHVWDGGPVTIDDTLSEGDRVAGFEVIDLPGHAPGLIGLWRERDRVALVSDAFYMTSMWGHPQDPALPLRAYNQDTERARESLRRLAALDPRIVLPGHLGPLSGPDVQGSLERAAEAPVG